MTTKYVEYDMLNSANDNSKEELNKQLDEIQRLINKVRFL